MKILLVNPPRFNCIPVGREDRCENTVPNVITPTGLVILAGSLEQKHQVQLIDANGYDLSFEYIRKQMEKDKAHFVIFKATPETFYSDVMVANMAKKVNKSIQTLMVCWSLTKIPKAVLGKAKNVDYYTIDYNYERPISDLCNGREPKDVLGISYREDSGNIRVNPATTDSFDFNALPMPAWHLLPDFSVYWVQVPSIRPCAFVESMKGCGMTCAFCTLAGIEPTFKKVDKAVNEIEYLYKKRKVKYINFFDATFNITKKRVFEICEEILRRDLRGLRWFANVRADRLDEEEARIMKDSGCEGVSVGVESGSQKILDIAEKKQTVEQAKRTVEVLKSAGISQYLSFIIGLPGEDEETLSQTKRFLLETKPTAFQANSLVPYPRCRLYDVAVEQGKIDPNLQWEDLHLFNTPISLCELTTEQINDYRKRLYRDVYLSPGWWLSNIKWVMQNSNDRTVGIHYALKVARRLIQGMNFEI